MKLLALLSFAALTAVGSSLSTLDVDDCIISYLKAKKLLGSEFRRNEELTMSCESLVEIIKTKTLLALERIFLEDEDISEYSNCMITSIAKTSYTDDSLLYYIYQNYNTTLTHEQSEEKETELMEKIQYYSTEAYVRCESGDNFETLFDSILSEDEGSSEEDLNEAESYCLRMHVIENNLFNLPGFTLIENPKSIDTTSVNCDEVYPEVLSKIEAEMVESLSDSSSSKESDESESKEDENLSQQCFLEVVRAGNYVEKLLPFDYLKEFELSEEQKAEEKRKFVDIMVEMSIDVINNCLQKK